MPISAKTYSELQGVATQLKNATEASEVYAALVELRRIAGVVKLHAEEQMRVEADED